MPEARENQNDYRAQSERITQPSQIIALLRRLHDSKTLVSVRIPGSDRYFSSMVLDINSSKGYILLDELNDDSAHKRALAAGKVYVFCQCRGVEMNFICQIHSVQNRQGIRFYQAPLPEYVNYLQRRSDYRVHVAMDMQVHVFIPTDDDNLMDGELCDVSMGGLGARMPGNHDLEKGLVIPDCRIQLPRETEPLSAELEVRFLLPDNHNKTLRLGGKFVRLTPEDKGRLRKFVMQMERELIRRKTRDDK